MYKSSSLDTASKQANPLFHTLPTLRGPQGISMPGLKQESEIVVRILILDAPGSPHCHMFLSKVPRYPSYSGYTHLGRKVDDTSSVFQVF